MWVGFLGSFRPLNHNLKQLCNYHEFFESNIQFQFGVCNTCGLLPPWGPRQGTERGKSAELAKAALEMAHCPTGPLRAKTQLTEKSSQRPISHRNMRCRVRGGVLQQSQDSVDQSSTPKKSDMSLSYITCANSIKRGLGKACPWKGRYRSCTQGDGLWLFSTSQSRCDIIWWSFPYYLVSTYTLILEMQRR